MRPDEIGTSLKCSAGQYHNFLFDTDHFKGWISVPMSIPIFT